MSVNSPTLRFVLLGNDTQVGMSLEQLFYERQIPYISASIEHLSSLDAVKQLLSQQQENKCFVVNCLFEEPSSGEVPDFKFWQFLNKQLIECCLASDHRLITLSSILVFSGVNEGQYQEVDQPDSNSELGLFYSGIEKELHDSERLEALTLRVGWLFSEMLGNILTRLVSAAVRQESLCISGKLRGCPTDAHSVARVIIAMSEQLDCNTNADLSGIYHYADSDSCTMHTFAKTVITIVKSMTDVRVESIAEGNSADMIDAVVETESFVPSCQKILSTFGIKQRPWRRSVHEVLKKKLLAEPSLVS